MMIEDIFEKIKNEQQANLEKCLAAIALPLMVEKEQFFQETDWLCARARKLRSRAQIIEMANNAARFAKELRRAHEEGITCKAGIRNPSQAIIDLNRFARVKPPRPDWKKFIARDCGQLFCFAFHTKPGRSNSVQKNGKNKYSGPFVEFCYFVINSNLEKGEKEARARSTIVDDIGEESDEIEKVWNRFRATDSLKQGLSL